MFAVCVDFDIKPGQMDAFLPRMRQQAEDSLRREPGCHLFDICHDPEAGTVFLYEIYSDAEAFQSHLNSAHFVAFDAEVAPMIAAKSVRCFAHVIRS